MAMSKVKIEEDCLKEDVDLKSVKQLIEQQVPKYGLKNCESSFFHWPIPIDYNSCNMKSDLFVIGRDVYIGQLTIRFAFAYNSQSTCNLKLNIERLINDSSKQTETFHSFQYFICKVKFYSKDGTKLEIFSLSKRAFIPDAKKNEIHFQFSFKNDNALYKASVEIYQELSTTSQYVSPSKNAVVGKIEKLSEKRNLVFEKKMLVVSPRFDFGSADQKMIVSFWHTQQGGGWGNDGVWVTLHVINEKEAQVGPPFTLKVSFTIFNQRENGSDFVKQVVLPRKENECQYPILLTLDNDFQNLEFFENDTLYYRVVVEPFNYKLLDEIVK